MADMPEVTALTALEAAGRIVRAADGWQLAECESTDPGADSP